MGKAVNIAGQRFGDRTVLRRAEKSDHQAWWVVRCICGRESVVRGTALRHRRVDRCVTCAHKITNLVGRRFGQRVVMARANDIGAHEVTWAVRCDCGRQDVVRGKTLLGGEADLCRACSSRQTATKHGQYKNGRASGLYRSWSGMKTRCNNVNSPNYRFYGGKGVSVYGTWADVFQEFMNDMGSTWFNGAALDRIDPTGNYDPGNCRWLTKRENSRLPHLTGCERIMRAAMGWPLPNCYKEEK